jgi:hypothetical protein
MRRKGLLDSWNVFVEVGANAVEEVLEAVERRIETAAMPGSEVSVNGDAITVTIRNLPDYQQVVRLRPYGAHLQCEHETLLAPRLLKRCLSGLLSGEGLHWSRIKRPDQERELRAATTVIRHALAESCKELVARRAGMVARRRDLDEVLESW